MRNKFTKLTKMPRPLLRNILKKSQISKPCWPILMLLSMKKIRQNFVCNRNCDRSKKIGVRWRSSSKMPNLPEKVIFSVLIQIQALKPWLHTFYEYNFRSCVPNQYPQQPLERASKTNRRGWSWKIRHFRKSEAPRTRSRRAFGWTWWKTGSVR